MENTPAAEPMPLANLELTPLAVSHMGEIRKWTHFFSILGFVFIGLMVILSLVIGFVFSSVMGNNLPFPTYLLTGVYLFIALLYFFPVLYLYRFSTQAKKGLSDRNTLEIESALGNLKSHFTVVGYITVAILIIYAIILSIIGIGAMFV